MPDAPQAVEFHQISKGQETSADIWIIGPILWSVENISEEEAALVNPANIPVSIWNCFSSDALNKYEQYLKTAKWLRLTHLDIQWILGMLDLRNSDHLGSITKEVCPTQ